MLQYMLQEIFLKLFGIDDRTLLRRIKRLEMRFVNFEREMDKHFDEHNNEEMDKFKGVLSPEEALEIKHKMLRGEKK